MRAAANLGLNVYFCDPHSPWQRGSNENTKRLLRQCLAKGVDLRQFSLHDLDNIAARINTRPRRVLDWASSAESFLPRVRAEYVSASRVRVVRGSGCAPARAWPSRSQRTP